MNDRASSLPRWSVIVVGILLGITAGHATAARQTDQEQRTKAAEARTSGSQRSEADRRREERREERAEERRAAAARKPKRGLDAAASAAASSLQRDGIRSAVAISRLGGAPTIETAGPLAEDPHQGLGRRLLFVSGLLLSTPRFADRPTFKPLIQRALGPSGTGVRRLETAIAQASYAGPDPMTDAATLLGNSGSLDASAEAPTASDLVRLLRSIAGGCAFETANPARAILNGLRQGGSVPVGSPAAVFEPGYTFAFMSGPNDRVASAAVIGRGDDGLVVTIATETDASDAASAALGRAWSALAERLPPPTNDPSARLPRTCSQRGATP